MEPHQLRYFVRVAELRHFTRAAAALNVAQPSLSQQLRKLERELGFALFVRGPAGVRLTSEGELFLPRARAVLDRLNDAAVAAAEIRGVRQGRLTLGVSPVAGARLLPPLLRRVAERLPGLDVRTREAGLDRLLQMLGAGEIDIATVLLPAADASLQTAPAMTDDLVVILPDHSPLAGAADLGVEALRDQPLILLNEEYGVRRRVEEECHRAGFEPRVVFESGQVAIIQGLVEAGLGLSVLPETAVRRDLRTQIRPLRSRNGRPQRTIGLAIPRDRYVPLAAREVFALAESLFADNGRAHSP